MNVPVKSNLVKNNGNTFFNTDLFFENLYKNETRWMLLLFKSGHYQLKYFHKNRNVYKLSAN